MRKGSIARRLNELGVIGSPRMAVLAMMSCSGIHSVSTRAASGRLSRLLFGRWMIDATWALTKTDVVGRTWGGEEPEDVNCRARPHRHAVQK